MKMGQSRMRLYFLWKNLRSLPSPRGPSPPPTFVPSGAQYTLVAMAMASQREVEGIGQKRPPTTLPYSLAPLPTYPHPGPAGGLWKKEMGSQKGREAGRL